MLKGKSSKPGVASVGKMGVITPKKTVTATVTVSSTYDSTEKGTLGVTVTPKAKSEKVAKKEVKKARFLLKVPHQKTVDSTWMYNRM